MGARLPVWDEKGRGGWLGGDAYTLYAFTDKLTGRVVVCPGAGSRRRQGRVGPNATVRIATRKEAEAGWQSPLHPGWKVDEG